jgi:hypothetical protein
MLVKTLETGSVRRAGVEILPIEGLRGGYLKPGRLQAMLRA